MRTRILRLFACAGIVLAVCLAFFLWSRASPLYYRGKHLEEWVEALEWRDAHTYSHWSWYETPLPKLEGKLPGQLEAIDAVRQIGSKALPILLAMLQAQEYPPESEVRRLIRRIESVQSSFTLPLGHGKDLRYRSVMAIEILGAQAAPLIPELTALLSRRDTCGLAAHALAAVGPGGLPPLLSVMTNSFAFERSDAPYECKAAVRAAGLLRIQNPRIVAAVSKCLSAAEDPRLRGLAAWSLGEIGLRSELITSALEQRLADSEKWVRVSAAQALGKLGRGSSAVSTLVNLLGVGDSALRAYGVLTVLAEMGDQASEAIPSLIHCLSDPDTSCASKAAKALGAIGIAGSEISEALVKAARHGQSTELRHAAIEALAQLAPDGDPFRDVISSHFDSGACAADHADLAGPLLRAYRRAASAESQQTLARLLRHLETQGHFEAAGGWESAAADLD